MAFSSTVKGSVYLGGAGGILLTYGEWSGAAGDAAGSITVGGPYLIGALFFEYDNDAATQIFPKVGISVSGSTTVLSVNNQDNVTTGRFIIMTAGGS